MIASSMNFMMIVIAATCRGPVQTKKPRLATGLDVAA
jgi:hypothetical protein